MTLFGVATKRTAAAPTDGTGLPPYPWFPGIQNKQPALPSPPRHGATPPPPLPHPGDRTAPSRSPPAPPGIPSPSPGHPGGLSKLYSHPPAIFPDHPSYTSAPRHGTDRSRISPLSIPPCSNTPPTTPLPLSIFPPLPL